MYHIRNRKSSYLRHAVLIAPKFGEKGSCPIDQTPSQSFNIDPSTGRPMSDITAIVRSQNALEMQAKFASLPEFKSNYLPEGTSNDDALVYQTPRLAQLPSELAEYRLHFHKLMDEKREKARLEKEQKELKEYVETNRDNHE